MIAWIQCALERRRKRLAALSYNRQFTFRGNGQCSWMCPTCCRVHRSFADNKLSGPQFAACCNFPAGGRLGKPFATLT